MTPAVEIRALSHAFGEGDSRKQVLVEIDLALAPGEIVIMTGPSGSGKTTLLTLVGALRSVQRGSVRVLGRELAGLSAGELVGVRRDIGFIFQTHNLFDSLTALQNVSLAQELHAEGADDRRRRAEAVLDRVGLAGRLDHRPRALSVGQSQRVAIARALVNRPRLVLADEPTAALDKDSGREVINLFRESAGERGCTVLLVTHDARILDAADRIVNLVDGRVASDVAVQRSLEICGFLSRTTVFARHTPSTLTEIAQHMGTERYPAGAVVFREGEEGDKFYVVRRGEVEIIRSGPEGSRVVAVLGPGNFFGEAALLTDNPRNATVRVREEAELYTLGRREFKSALDSSKSFKDELLGVFLNRQ